MCGALTDSATTALIYLFFNAGAHGQFTVTNRPNKTEQKIDKKKRKRKREKRKTRKGEKEEKRKRRKDEKRKRRKEKKKKRQKKRKKRKDKNRTKAKNCYMIPNKITQAQHFLSGTSFANILRKIFYEQ